MHKGGHFHRLLYMSIDLISATADDFEAFIGEIFTVQTADGPINLTLENIKRYNAPSSTSPPLEIDGVIYPQRTPFGLTLKGPKTPLLVTMTYKTENDRTGPLDLFLSAFEQNTDGTFYESLFN